jgi:acyl carrier protein
VQWAPWRLASLVDDEAITTMRRMGLRPLEPAVALAALDRLLAARTTIASVVEADEPLLLAVYRQALRWPLFDELGTAPDKGIGPDDGPGSRLAEQLAALPAAQRYDVLVEQVLGDVAAVLGMQTTEDLADDDGFFELGMNSVGAVELRIRLQRHTGVELPSTIAFEHPTATALARYLAAALQLEAPLVDEPPGPTPERAAAGPSEDTEDELLARFESEMTAARDATQEEWPWPTTRS